jgi:hypothetical protein
MHQAVLSLQGPWNWDEEMLGLGIGIVATFAGLIIGSHTALAIPKGGQGQIWIIAPLVQKEGLGLQFAEDIAPFYAAPNVKPPAIFPYSLVRAFAHLPVQENKIYCAYLPGGYGWTAAGGCFRTHVRRLNFPGCCDQASYRLSPYGGRLPVVSETRLAKEVVATDGECPAFARKVGPGLRYADLSTLNNGLFGSFSSPNGGVSSPSSEKQRSQHSNEASESQLTLKSSPPSSFFSRLRHTPLLAQIGVLTILWALAMGIVWGSFGLLLFGNGHGLRLLGDWRWPRRIGSGLLFLGVLIGSAAVWLSAAFTG